MTRPEQGEHDAVEQTSGTGAEVVHAADGSVRPPTIGEETVAAHEVDVAERDHEHPEVEQDIPRIRLGPVLALLIGLGGTVLAVAGLRQISSIVAPTFLAVTMIIAVYPVHRWLRRFVPSALSAVVMVLLLYGILAALLAGIGLAAANFATEVTKDEYADTYAGLLDDARDLAAQVGIDEQQINQYLEGFDLSSLTGFASGLVDALSGAGSLMILLLTVMIFLAMDAGGFPQRLDAIHRVKPDIADALQDFGLRVRKYWIVSTVFGIIVAVIDYVALLLLGVPLAATFGLLAFITNYIPNVGFVLGLVPPAIIALLDGGVSTMIWVIVIYCVANFAIQSILQPKFTGDAVGINATTAFISLVFWAYVFGALGALLAIPFTLLVKSLLIDRDPRSRWINQFIASNPDDEASAQPL